MPDRSELPLADYDHLPVATLQHRIRALAADELRALLDYERAHADRVPVVELMTARLDQLAAGATPSGGDQGNRPEQAGPPDGGSRVDPSGAAPPSQPLREGVAGQTPNRDLQH